MDARGKIAELLETIAVEDYLDAEGIDWKPTHGSSGPQANLRTCPVCGGSDWKVYLGLETGLGNCFHGSCGAHFNKWSFIKAHLGVDKAGPVIDHLEATAKALGWRPKRMVSAATFTPPALKLPLSFALPTAEGQNLLYLEARGVTAEYARYFQLRYCDDAWWNFTKADGTPGGQNFGGRVIIPIFDLDGELVTFQGRDVTGEHEKRRKYLFPSGLPGAARFLYNGHNAFRARRLLVNEGVFDVIASKIAIDGESELRDIVPLGTFGKHLSVGDKDGNDQLTRFVKLRRYGAEEVIMMWDGEVAALNDAITAGEHLSKIGYRVKIALLPKGKDPNEVPPVVVRETIWKAQLLTPKLAVQLRLMNPYR